MKAVILCAGSGTRLRPLTNDQPKCMVKYAYHKDTPPIPIIDHILDTLHACHIDQIALINGYKKEVLTNYLQNRQGRSLSFFTNPHFATTNMVYTLFCAKDFFKSGEKYSQKDSKDDLIISYGDIVYNASILSKLIDSKADFCVVVDRKWRELWQQRMENPLADAETLQIKDNNIIEIGKKPKSYEEIQGQYIGLIKISKYVIDQVTDFYDHLDRDRLYDGKDVDNIYMTSFIQLIIDNLMPVTPIYIDGGWVEIDSAFDLNARPIIKG